MTGRRPEPTPTGIAAGSGAPLGPGDPVVFVDREGREHYAVLGVGRLIDIRGNVVPHDRLFGAPEGVRVRGSRAVEFRVVRATLAQHARHMQRHAQIIYPKDLALLVTYADLFPGARVIEGGYGSGALTMAILRAIGPTGRLVTYELHAEAKNRADKNVRAYLGADAQAHHEVRIGDLYQGIAEERVDRILLDVPEPWDVVPHAARALNPGGLIAAYVPTAIQLQRFVLAAHESRAFLPAESLETIERWWRVTRESLRPQQKMIGHTGFLAFARRVADAFIDCVA
ncbi:MAG: tRNA (adenine-N1)-methyltransferase [Deltaproteobacteria bacterium]|nr:tRNA (adenine-N1)-methyltransferase [Deltaproteobacteria bacterium]